MSDLEFLGPIGRLTRNGRNSWARSPWIMLAAFIGVVAMLKLARLPVTPTTPSAIELELPGSADGALAVLRAYQHEGLAWMQFLREFNLAGILADDMGLGKTVEVLAHVAVERAAGRLRHPVLVVSPTSVAPNWRAEIARFLPDASVLALTGGECPDRILEIGLTEIVEIDYAVMLGRCQCFSIGADRDGEDG